MINIENIKYHEREENYVEIEENILNRVLDLGIEKRCIDFLMPMPDEEHLVVFSWMSFHVTCCAYV